MKKYFGLTFIVVCLINLILWMVLNPIDQNEIAVISSVSFFNRIVAVIITMIEGVFIGAKVNQMHGIKIENDSCGGNERTDYKVRGFIKQMVAMVLVAVVILGTCRFSYQKIDEKGYTFVSPINQYTFLWDDMEYYAYYSTEIGGRTYIKFDRVESVKLIKLDDKCDLNLKLFRFNRLTKAAKNEYKTEEEFLDEIFVKKYGQLEAEWDDQEKKYVLKYIN